MAKFCTNCGASLSDETRICTECGATLDVAAPPANEAAPTSAAQPIQQTQPVYQAVPTATAVAEPPQKAKRQRAVSYDDDAPAPGSKYEPISTWGYIGISLLMCIPIVGIIIAIVWAVGGCRKINKRNFARAMLIMMVIGLIFSLIIGFALKALFNTALEAIEQETGVNISEFAESGGEGGLGALGGLLGGGSGSSNNDGGGAGDIAGLLGGLVGLAGDDSGDGPTNSDIEALQELQGLLGGLEGVTGDGSGEGGGLNDLIDGAIEANQKAEAANDGWPSTLREYPGGNAKATASYRTEISDTTLEEMMGWIEDLKKDGFKYQDFYDFGMSEEDMLGMNGWWAYDGKTYLSVSFSEGTVIVDHTKELPDLSGLLG